MASLSRLSISTIFFLINDKCVKVFRQSFSYCFNPILFVSSSYKKTKKNRNHPLHRSLMRIQKQETVNVYVCVNRGVIKDDALFLFLVHSLSDMTSAMADKQKSQFNQRDGGKIRLYLFNARIRCQSCPSCINNNSGIGCRYFMM